MSTLVLTRATVFNGRKRSLSLALIAARAPSPLHNIPAELLINILEFAIQESKLYTLASISRLIHNAVYSIVYRAVILNSRRRIRLFHRTLTSKFFNPFYVKNLAITWVPERQDSLHVLFHQLQEIVMRCSSISTLAVASLQCMPDFASINTQITWNNLTALTVRSFEKFHHHLDPFSTSRWDSLTHLRICEPSDAWYSPSFILSSFGSLPALSHFQLPRRSNSNEENDLVFSDELRSLLHARSMLKLVAIEIFNDQPWLSAEHIMTSNIWKLISAIDDERVALSVADYGQWKDGWNELFNLGHSLFPNSIWKHMGVVHR